jgi:hypothetical protein
VTVPLAFVQSSIVLPDILDHPFFKVKMPALLTTGILHAARWVPFEHVGRHIVILAEPVRR